MKKKSRSNSSRFSSGFMLIEVLIALALFALSAVFLVDGAFIASRVAKSMKDTRELEQDLIWARDEILGENSVDYEKFSEGGEIEGLSIGPIYWEPTVEMTEVLDLYKVVLRLEYDGNGNFEPGEKDAAMYLLRPTWKGHRDFSTDYKRLEDDTRRRIEEFEEERKRLNR